MSKWVVRWLQNFLLMKNNALKQCSSSTNPKTWHMASLASSHTQIWQLDENLKA